MSQIIAESSKKRGRRKSVRGTIRLPNDEGYPRSMLAEELGVCEATIRRVRLPTLYVGGVAYHPYRASMEALAKKIRRSPR
jgi:hypothetical protein